MPTSIAMNTTADPISRARIPRIALLPRASTLTAAIVNVATEQSSPNWLKGSESKVVLQFHHTDKDAAET